MIPSDWLVIATCAVGLACCAIPLLPVRKAERRHGWIRGSLDD